MKIAWLKKVCFLMVLTILVTSSLAACGKKAETAPAATASEESTAEPAASSKQQETDPIQAEIAKGKVELQMYLVGDAQTDQELVYGKINELMEKDINTTVSVNNISWADFLKKYQLIFASGEEFDCAFAGAFCSYYDLATKNAFKEIDEDLIKTYAPATYANLDAYYVKGTKVNGKMYMIPADQHDVRGSLVAIRGDLREKYSLPEIKSVDDYYQYLIEIAKNEKVTPFYSNTDDTSWVDSLFSRYNGIANINNTFCNNVKQFEGTLTVYNALESQEFIDFAKKMEELNQADVFPKNMLSQKTQGQDLFKAGTTASYMQEPNGLFSTVSEINRDHPEWKIEIYDISNPNMPLSGLAPADAGLVLHPATKYPERCMMMLDLFRQNKQYHDLTYLGIEGKHWKAEGDLKYSALDASKAFPFNAACPWAWTNDDFKRVDVSTPQSLLDIKAKWLTMSKDTPITAFAFDDTNVKNEEAVISNIITKYKNVLIYGFSSDPEKDIAQMNAELKKAGLEKVLKETQTKLDEFLVNFNKN